MAVSLLLPSLPTSLTDLQVACRDYIFNQSFEDGEGKSFTCDPVFPSNISSELTGETYTTVWRKFLYRDELIGFMKASEPNQTADFDEYVLNKGRYQTTTSVRKGDEVTINFNSARTNIELNVRDEGRHLIGFYAPSVEVQMQENFTLLAPFFAVYCECPCLYIVLIHMYTYCLVSCWPPGQRVK